jgi:hypothetical protein
MPFPSTPILDDFNTGANQLLDNRAGWSNGSRLATGTISLQTDSVPTAADANNAPTTTAHSNVWATQFPADQEVWFTYGGFVDDCIIYTRISALSPTTPTAYALHVRFNGVGHAIIDRSGAQVATFTTATPVTGDSFCLQAIATTLRAWFRPNGGTWKQLAAANDSVFNAAGYIGLMQLASGSTNIDSFAGGAASADVYSVRRGGMRR